MLDHSDLTAAPAQQPLSSPAASLPSSVQTATAGGSDRPAAASVEPAPAAPASGGLAGSGGFATAAAGASAAAGVAAALLLILVFAPCLGYGRVAVRPARWRPVLFVSLLERPG
jgi:hypothetical protein